MPIRYFKKAYPQNPLIISGKPMLFRAYPSGVGLLAVDPVKHPAVIKEFELMMAKGRGGFVEITAQEFEDEKKKGPRARKSEALSLAQVNQYRSVAARVGADLADAERARRQVTPVISRSFKRPGMKYAGATANPEPGQPQPGQYRPGLSDRP